MLFGLRYIQTFFHRPLLYELLRKFLWELCLLLWACSQYWVCVMDSRQGMSLAYNILEIKTSLAHFWHHWVTEWLKNVSPKMLPGVAKILSSVSFVLRKQKRNHFIREKAGVFGKSFWYQNKTTGLAKTTEYRGDVYNLQIRQVIKLLFFKDGDRCAREKL